MAKYSKALIVFTLLGLVASSMALKCYTCAACSEVGDETECPSGSDTCQVSMTTRNTGRLPNSEKNIKFKTLMETKP